MSQLEYTSPILDEKIREIMITLEKNKKDFPMIIELWKSLLINKVSKLNDYLIECEEMLTKLNIDVKTDFSYETIITMLIYRDFVINLNK